MRPPVILSRISLATGPDETAMMIVNERPGKTTPEWCEKEKSGRDMIFVVDSYIQVWYAYIRPLLAQGVMLANHSILWGLFEACVNGECKFFEEGGGGFRETPYRSERASKSGKPVPIPWSAVVDSSTHISEE